MKKWLKNRCRLLGLVLCGLLAVGCAAKPVAQNSIWRLEPTEDQAEMLSLMGGVAEAHFFEFATTEPYSDTEIWVERYDAGVLAEENLVKVHSMQDEPMPLKGKVGITISGDTWTVVLRDGGGGQASHNNTEMTDYMEGGEAIGRMSAPLEGSAGIKAGQELVLYARLYSANGELRAYDVASFGESPALLENYDHAYLVKFRLS